MFQKLVEVLQLQTSCNSYPVPGAVPASTYTTTYVHDKEVHYPADDNCCVYADVMCDQVGRRLLTSIIQAWMTNLISTPISSPTLTTALITLSISRHSNSFATCIYNKYAIHGCFQSYICYFTTAPYALPECRSLLPPAPFSQVPLSWPVSITERVEGKIIKGCSGEVPEEHTPSEEGVWWLESEKSHQPISIR